MRITCCLVSLMSICMLLLTQFSLVQSDAISIAKTCKRTRNPNLCVKVVSLNPYHRSASFEFFVPFVVIDVVEVKAKTVYAMIKSKPGKCTENFETILNTDIDQVRQGFGTYYGRKAIRGGLSNEAKECLKQLPQGSPVAGLTKEVTDLADVAAFLI